MAQSFRDLRIWQDAFSQFLKIYKISKDFPHRETYILESQLKKAALSVMANIAESHGRYGYQDKIQFLVVARGSVEETRSHLSAVEGLRYINKETFQLIDDSYQRLAKGINGFISYIRQQKASTHNSHSSKTD